MSKLNVLFLCTSNAVRTQMAEAFVQHYAGEVIEAYSAGITAPDKVHPLTVAVMEECDISMKGKKAKLVDDLIGAVPFDYVITLSEQTEQEYPAALAEVGTHLNWIFPDPSLFEGTRQEQWVKFRMVRDQIDAQVRQWVAELNIVVR